jgi:RNA polymerase primary sigma factor
MKKKEYTKDDVAKIIALGRQKGYLTYDEVNELLPEDISSSEDIDRIFEILGNEDIQLIESGEEKETEKEIEKQAQAFKDEMLAGQLKAEERFMPLDDPVKMYLKQMGSISLLSRESELELAKKIEETDQSFKCAALSVRFIRRSILSIAADAIDGKVNLEEVVKEDARDRDVSILKRFKKITERLKETRSETKTTGLLLQFNFTTSVIESAVRRLNGLLREIDSIGR